jgi:biopolymer transport protein ExbB
LIEFLVKGGIVMIPIAVLSVLGLALIVERGVFYLRIRERTPNLGGRIVELLARKEVARVRGLLEVRRSPVSDVLKAGLRQARRKPEEMHRGMESQALRWAGELERNVGYLSSIANLATLLGLLGTVTGMIRSFFNLRAAGISDPAVLAGGIAEALITTAAGLVVAIPCLFCYHIFHQLVQRILSRMEIASTELLTFFSRGKSGT